MERRRITGKASQYKLLWVGNNSGYGGVGIFVAQKWVEMAIEVKGELTFKYNFG